MNKKQDRLRRTRKTRGRIRERGDIRLCVHKTHQHVYAQVIAANGSEVLASASTVDKTVRKDIKNGGNVEAAISVGKLVAQRAKEAGVTRVAFDRSGFKYHGRIKALADAAREHGMEF